MPGRFFRILTPGGTLSQDRFVLPARQPQGLPADCVAVMHEQTGATLVVHDTRLFPADAARTMPVLGEPRSVCHKCGRVMGVAEDHVGCPEHEGTECGIRRAVNGLGVAKCV